MELIGNSPLLITKTIVPGLTRKTVLRTKLFERIDLNQEWILTLVNAPAGFGKTTFISSWINQKKKKAAWVSLDEIDKSPLLFFAYLIKAIQQIDPSLCISIQNWIYSSDPPPIRTIMIGFINEMASLNDELIIVLDDFHLIDNKETHDFIELLIENIPPLLKLIVITRNKPEFAISTLRINQQIIEINDSHLRFSIPEAIEFFDLNLAEEISRECVQRIVSSTEGWVTGLQISSISFKNALDDCYKLPEICGGNKFVADYFFEEILDHLEVNEREFLLISSLYKSFSSPLCNHALQIEDSQGIICNFDDLNLFIVPLDLTRTWYRYNYLFQDFLNNQLNSTYSKEEIAEFIGRGIEWFLKNGVIEEAIDLMLQINNYSLATDIISSNFDSFYNKPESRILLEKWLSEIPLDYLRARRNVWYGYVLLLFKHRKFTQGKKVLSLMWGNAGELTGLNPEEAKSILGYKALLESIISRHTTMDYKNIYEKSIVAIKNIPKEETGKIWISKYINSFSAALMDKAPVHQKRLTERHSDQAASRKISLFASRMNYIAQSAYLSGRLTKAKELYESTLQISEEDSLQEIGVYGDVSLGLGKLHYEWNDLDVAKEMIYEGLNLIQQRRSAESIFTSWLAAYPILCSDGKIAEMERMIEHLAGISNENSSPPIVESRTSAMRAQVSLHRADLDSAIRWSNDFLDKHDVPSSLYRFEWSLVSKICFMRGAFPQAIEILQVLADLANRNGHYYERNQKILSSIAAYYQIGKSDIAIELFSGILDDLRIEGYIQTILDQGIVMKRFLNHFIESKNPDQTNLMYIQNLLTKIDLDKGFSLKNSRAVTGELLSQRENEVLMLLAKGHQYKQIALDLNISLNTVRSYTKRLYQKLNVHNRMAAVIKWQEIHYSRMR